MTGRAVAGNVLSLVVDADEFEGDPDTSDDDGDVDVFEGVVLRDDGWIEGE